MGGGLGCRKATRAADVSAAAEVFASGTAAVSFGMRAMGRAVALKLAARKSRWRSGSAGCAAWAMDRLGCQARKAGNDMTEQDFIVAARAALQRYVRGRTIELGAASCGTFADAELIDREVGTERAYLALEGIEPGSVDTILSIDGASHCTDIVVALHAWRRALRAGGVLGLVFGTGSQGVHQWSASAFVSVLQLTGGFKVASIEELDGCDGAFMIVAEQHAASLVSSPFGLIGPEIAQACLADPKVLGELHFYLGTILVQAGEAASAVPHYRKVLESEPESYEARFGLGMCLGRIGEWSAALTEFEQCLQLHPNDGNVVTWIELARDRIAAEVQQQDEAAEAKQVAITPQSAAARVQAPATPQQEAVASTPQGGLRAARSSALRIGDRG